MTVGLTGEERKLQITRSEDIYPILQSMLLRENKIDRQKEHFWTVGINSAGGLEYVELAASGSLSQVAVVPAAVYRFAAIKAPVTLSPPITTRAAA